jgi:hypothetical protein
LTILPFLYIVSHEFNDFLSIDLSFSGPRKKKKPIAMPREMRGAEMMMLGRDQPTPSRDIRESHVCNCGDLPSAKLNLVFYFIFYSILLFEKGKEGDQNCYSIWT